MYLKKGNSTFLVGQKKSFCKVKKSDISRNVKYISGIKLFKTENSPKKNKKKVIKTYFMVV